jgi:hypothetical protein
MPFKTIITKIRLFKKGDMVMIRLRMGCENEPDMGYIIPGQLRNPKTVGDRSTRNSSLEH